MPTIFDIIKMTPKTNCGQCGFSTCMTFGAAVVSGASPLNRCPHIDMSQAPADLGQETKRETDPDTALVKELKSKIEEVDLGTRADNLGGEISTRAGKEGIAFRFLGREVFISKTGISDGLGKELDPRDQILLYNYVFFNGRTELLGDWVGLESFPNSISKVTTLRRYSEERLASGFAGRLPLLEEKALTLEAERLKDCQADLCLEIFVLPRLPLRLYLWDQDMEEGFDARCKILFNSTAIQFLDLESLVFAAERLTETLLDYK